MGLSYTISQLAFDYAVCFAVLGLATLLMKPFVKDWEGRWFAVHFVANM